MNRNPAPPQPAIPAGLRHTPPTQRGRVDAGGTMLRLRALHVMGHGCARIAGAAGVSVRLIQRVVRGEARTVSPAVRAMVADVYDRWWDKRAPERTRRERAAAQAARGRARRGGWCAPAALDDDQLDRPGYQPLYGWLPATGTGTAVEPAPGTRVPEPSAGLWPVTAGPPGGRHRPAPGGRGPGARTVADPAARAWARAQRLQRTRPPEPELSSAAPPPARRTREPGHSPRTEREAAP